MQLKKINNRRNLALGKKRVIVKFYFLLFFKFPPLPAKAQVNASAKVIKQLGEYACRQTPLK